MTTAKPKTFTSAETSQCFELIWSVNITIENQKQKWMQGLAQPIFRQLHQGSSQATKLLHLCSLCVLTCASKLMLLAPFWSHALCRTIRTTKKNRLWVDSVPPSPNNPNTTAIALLPTTHCVDFGSFRPIFAACFAEFVPSLKPWSSAFRARISTANVTWFPAQISLL